MMRTLLLHVEIETGHLPHAGGIVREATREEVRQTIEDILPTISLAASTRLSIRRALVLSQIASDSCESLEQLVDTAIDNMLQTTAALHQLALPLPPTNGA